jgi:hypothetical protein
MIAGRSADKKTEHAQKLRPFGSSAIFVVKDPPLSVPASRRVWLFGRQ